MEICDNCHIELTFKQVNYISNILEKYLFCSDKCLINFLQKSNSPNIAKEKGQR